MQKIAVILLVVCLLCLASFEAQQAYAACKCMCHEVSGLPSSVSVDDTGACDRDFEYTFSAHFATNDDCSGGLSASGVAYTGSPSSNMNHNDISPTSFTIYGAGHTQSFTVTGDLLDQGTDGISSTGYYTSGFECYLGSQDVDIIHDPDCP